MPPPELRAPAQGVCAFDSEGWTPPAQILLDTSVVVDFLLQKAPSHPACLGFIENLVSTGSTIVFNRLLETELVEALFRHALKDHWGKQWKMRRGDGRARRRADRLLRKGLQGWQELLAAANWFAIEHAAVSEDVPDLVARYGLGSYDAIHAATAVRMGVKDIATLDHGFAALPKAELIIHTTSLRLKSMRARR